MENSPHRSRSSSAKKRRTSRSMSSSFSNRALHNSSSKRSRGSPSSASPTTPETLPLGLGFEVPKKPDRKIPAIRVPMALRADVASAVKRKHDTEGLRLLEQHSAIESELKKQKHDMHKLEVEMGKTKRKHEELMESAAETTDHNIKRTLRATTRELSKMEIAVDKKQEKLEEMVHAENEDYKKLMMHRKRVEPFNGRIEYLKTIARKKNNVVKLPNGKKVTYETLPSNLKLLSRRHERIGGKKTRKYKGRQRPPYF